MLTINFPRFVYIRTTFEDSNECFLQHIFAYFCHRCSLISDNVCFSSDKNAISHMHTFVLCTCSKMLKCNYLAVPYHICKRPD